MEKIFFDSWESIIRTLIITVLAYIGLILFLRLSGKRTLSKMNAFDFIVTIALGSTLATVMLNKNVALVDGLLGFFLLIFLQFLITYLSARYKGINELVKSTPSLLAYKGEMLMQVLKRERISREEIMAFLRKKGKSSLEPADAIVLETDGTLTLIPNLDNMESESMKPVEAASLRKS